MLERKDIRTFKILGCAIVCLLATNLTLQIKQLEQVEEGQAAVLDVAESFSPLVLMTRTAVCAYADKEQRSVLAQAGFSCSDKPLTFGEATQEAVEGREQYAKDHAPQHAQAARKPTGATWRGYGQTFILSRDGFAYLNDHAMALDEKTSQATVFSEGLYQVIVYKSGKVKLLKSGQLVGDLRK